MLSYGPGNNCLACLELVQQNREKPGPIICKCCHSSPCLWDDDAIMYIFYLFSSTHKHNQGDRTTQRIWKFLVEVRISEMNQLKIIDSEIERAHIILKHQVYFAFSLLHLFLTSASTLPSSFYVTPHYFLKTLFLPFSTSFPSSVTSSPSLSNIFSLFL